MGGARAYPDGVREDRDPQQDTLHCPVSGRDGEGGDCGRMMNMQFILTRPCKAPSKAVLRLMGIVFHRFASNGYSLYYRKESIIIPGAS